MLFIFKFLKNVFKKCFCAFNVMFLFLSKHKFSSIFFVSDILMMHAVH